MWMGGDGVDGGGKVIKCCFSRGPLFSLDNPHLLRPCVRLHGGNQPVDLSCYS